jgi:hypothetical protein
MTDRVTISVSRGVNTFQQLIHRLKMAASGCYLVWVHEGRVVKLASVSRPEKVEHDVEQIPAP